MVISIRYSLRLMLLGLAAAVAGCAAQQSAGPAAAKPAPLQERTAKQKVDAAIANGYTVKNENGKTMFCRKDLQTGSHARYKTSCMTEKEWDQLSESSRQSIQDMSRRVTPPRGT